MRYFTFDKKDNCFEAKVPPWVTCKVELVAALTLPTCVKVRKSGRAYFGQQTYDVTEDGVTLGFFIY
jgi:hypothetical protein